MNISKQNPLTYNLGLLTEECGEVVQVINKIRRFGLISNWDGETNKQKLFNEINDILAVVELLEQNFNIEIRDESRIQEKKDKIAKFMVCSEQEGFLE